MNVHQVVHITLWFISSRLKSIIDSIVWCQVTIINVTILPILAIIKCDITLKILSKHYIIIWPINKLFLFIVYTILFFNRIQIIVIIHSQHLSSFFFNNCFQYTVLILILITLYSDDLSPGTGSSTKPNAINEYMKCL